MVEFTSWRKSTRSNDTAEADCVECRQSWRKSSRSSDTADADCIEARNTTAGFQVRDSKLGHDSPVFDLSGAEFTGLLRAVTQA
jgi:hypothetical protein